MLTSPLLHLRNMTTALALATAAHVAMAGAPSGSASDNLATLTRAEVEAHICRPGDMFDRVTGSPTVCGPREADEENMKRIGMIAALAGGALAGRKVIRRRQKDMDSGFLSSRTPDSFFGTPPNDEQHTDNYSIQDQRNAIGNVDQVQEAAIYIEYYQYPTAIHRLAMAITMEQTIKGLREINQKLRNILKRSFHERMNKTHAENARFVGEIQAGRRREMTPEERAFVILWGALMTCQEKIAQTNQQTLSLVETQRTVDIDTTLSDDLLSQFDVDMMQQIFTDIVRQPTIPDKLRLIEEKMKSFREIDGKNQSPSPLEHIILLLKRAECMTKPASDEMRTKLTDLARLLQSRSSEAIIFADFAAFLKAHESLKRTDLYETLLGQLPMLE